MGKCFGGKKFGKLEWSEFDLVLDDLDMFKCFYVEIRCFFFLFILNLEELIRLNVLIVDECNWIDCF